MVLVVVVVVAAEVEGGVFSALFGRPTAVGWSRYPPGVRARAGARAGPWVAVAVVMVMVMAVIYQVALAIVMTLFRNGIESLEKHGNSNRSII